MKRSLLEVLRCPATRQPLGVDVDDERDGEIFEGMLTTSDGAHQYPIRSGIPRFVPQANYADSFGLQWNRFRRSQLDSHSGVPISHDRFYAFTGWRPQELAGRRVLDVGCGAGRFAEIALAAGASVVAVDYSSAVEACRANLAGNPRLEVVQGDIYRLPFAPASFDFVYCLGVLQHTPDVRGAFMSLPPFVIPGGKIAVDLYPKLLRNLFSSKYWVRPLTRRLPPGALFSLVERAVPVLLPISRVVGRIPKLGRKLRYLIPVSNYDGVFPLSEAQLNEWATLDTFDMLSPRYDQPQSVRTLREWMTAAAFQDVDVFRRGFVVGRARRPTTDT